MSNKINISQVCKDIRKDVLVISHNAHIGHVGSALSVVEILAVLYLEILKINPNNPDDESRDYFILSKGHAAAALYSTLSLKGFFSKNILNTFLQDNSKLLVHPEPNSLPGIEHGTGSLGHGFPVGVGMAYALKKRNLNNKVYVLLSDSEVQEGTTWESALFASHHKLDNLTIVIDYNNSQAFGKTNDILKIEPIEKKWKSFNFHSTTIDGHNTTNLKKQLGAFIHEKPKVVIAKTVLGKGVSFMENDFKWHYLNTQSNQLEEALKELK